MPDSDTVVNPGSPPGAADNMIVTIDTDNNSTTERFTIENDGGGLSHRQFMVEESGHVRLYGPLEASGPITLKNQVVNSSPVVFHSMGTELARIDGEGKGMFSAGGINLPVLTSTPNGSRSGAQGDVVIWYDTGAARMRLATCVGGTVWTVA